ncbi:MAG: DUF6498-containing protein [bacterium]
MLSPVSYEILVGNISSRLPLALLILANLFPLYAVAEGYWDVTSLVMLYWAENLVIGFYSLLKILLAGADSPIRLLGNLFFAVFFCIHFGGFVGVHGVFLVSFFPVSNEEFNLSGLDWPLFFVFVQILWEITRYIFANMPVMMHLGVMLLMISHGVSFVVNYFGKGEIFSTNSRAQMAAPYGRIVVLHITIIAGGFFVMAMDSQLALLVVLIALKILMDVGLHIRSHRKLRREAQEN